MVLLAIESSCDETSVAVVRDGVVLANVVSSQIRLHAEYGGIVPELATRAHLRNLLPVAETALREAGVAISELGAIAATRGPGLPSALLVGCRAAEGLAFCLGKPFFGIHHHEAHLYSPWVRGHPLRADFGAFQPNVSLIVSGGHTILAEVSGVLKHRVLGSTVDDAAGECFDKVAKLIGLGYPGGPEVERMAAGGNPAAFDFPRPMRTDPGDDFSFSGLKTSVRYFLRDHPGWLEDLRQTRDLCASVQAAIVDVLVAKAMRAARRLGRQCLTASGGVACNGRLRAELEKACASYGMGLRVAERSLCTDNAAMIAILAEQKLAAGLVPDSYDAEVLPNWELDRVTSSAQSVPTGPGLSRC